MIHDEICTYEVAKLAKEKGFPQDPNKNGHCEMYCWDGLRNIHSLGTFVVWYMEEYNHDNLYAAPNQNLLQRWLRKEKFIDIAIYPIFRNEVRIYTCYVYAPNLNKPKKLNYFDTYELSLEDALKYALENLI